MEQTINTCRYLMAQKVKVERTSNLVPEINVEMLLFNVQNLKSLKGMSRLPNPDEVKIFNTDLPVSWCPSNMAEKVNNESSLQQMALKHHTLGAHWYLSRTCHNYLADNCFIQLN